MNNQIVMLITLFVFGTCCVTSGFSEPRSIDLGHGYSIWDVTASHEDAKKMCDLVGKVLVSIETLEEDQLIVQLLRSGTVVPNPNSGIWSSGHNSVAPRIWLWGSNEPLYYSRWAVSYPLEDNNTFCLVIGSLDSYRYWFSRPCLNKYYPLCETIHK